jgi:ABC-type nitrate/sulfonate/bicarbonate transport system substrate-binding protein/outer membrane protein OmpA-like peptidoglycan-associated protein
MQKQKLLLIGGVWVFLVAILAMGYKFFVAPKVQEEQVKIAQEQRKSVIQNTSAQSRYQHRVSLALDSFSGYAVLRSQQFLDYCGTYGIQIDLVDDKADYNRRLMNLKSGDIQMATFTLDALIASSASVGDMPATAVAIIDESHGADAMVVEKNTNLDVLNDPATRFVLIPDSPSQTLVQVVRHYFQLDRLAADPFIRVNNPDEIIARYKSSKPNDKLVFVTWQPEILKMVSNQNYKVLMDSSRFRDYILDVLVVNRDFLIKNEEVVRRIVESYFRANYDLSVKEDLVRLDANLSAPDAKSVAEGISWRNTQENYAQFGFSRQPGYGHIEDSIVKITRVLMQGGTIKSDPTAGNPNVFYYDKILRSLFESNFHPGNNEEQVQGAYSIHPITDEQWKKLIPVGTMQVDPLVFARGTDRLTGASEQILADLAENLKTWQHYYLVVKGHTAGDNTPENLDLQKRRAQAAVDWLVQHEVNPAQVRAEASQSNGSTTVKFVLGQLPY